MANCPLCGSSSEVIFQTRYGPQPNVAGVQIELESESYVLSCAACDFRFTSPPPDNEIVQAAYKRAGTNVWREDPKNAIRRNYRGLVEAIVRSACRPSVLDIGCYTGAFLDEFPDSWKKYGIEMSNAAAEIATSRGIDIIGSDFFETPIPSEGFGAISAMNIIEHVPDPVAFIRRATLFLKPGGVLLIETGDFRSTFARILGDCWFYYHTPEHVSFFSQRGLEKLMYTCSLEILESRSGLFHKRPVGIKPWLFHLLQIARALGYRSFHRWYNDHYPIPWVTHKDHVLLIGRKA